MYIFIIILYTHNDQHNHYHHHDDHNYQNDHAPQQPPQPQPQQLGRWWLAVRDGEHGPAAVCTTPGEGCLGLAVTDPSNSYTS